MTIDPTGKPTGNGLASIAKRTAALERRFPTAEANARALNLKVDRLEAQIDALSRRLIQIQDDLPQRLTIGQKEQP